MVSNDFLPFCPTDTGTNLLSESDYAASPDRTSGNKPGVASSKLVNRAIRQSSMVSSQLAQILSDNLSANVVDDANAAAKMYAQLAALLQPIAPVITRLVTPGAVTFNPRFFFFIVAGNATANATYTNNTVTFTVKKTIAGGTFLETTGPGAPTVSGTLTKASGTGDATLTFYAFRSNVFARVRIMGAGGGGAGGGNTGIDGTTGGDTTINATDLLAHGGGHGIANNGNGVSGGTASGTFSSSLIEIHAIQGGGSMGGSLPAATNQACSGGLGGSSSLGGAGSGSAIVSAGAPAAPNSGAGGSGGSGNGVASGSGGSAGAFMEAQYNALQVSLAVVIGAKGTGGANSAGGATGGDGSDGEAIFEEFF